MKINNKLKRYGVTPVVRPHIKAVNNINLKETIDKTAVIDHIKQIIKTNKTTLDRLADM